jgi:hypothetical protein
MIDPNVLAMLKGAVLNRVWPAKWLCELNNELYNSLPALLAEVDRLRNVEQERDMYWFSAQELRKEVDRLKAELAAKGERVEELRQALLGIGRSYQDPLLHEYIRKALAPKEEK